MEISEENLQLYELFQSHVLENHPEAQIVVNYYPSEYISLAHEVLRTRRENAKLKEIEHKYYIKIRSYNKLMDEKTVLRRQLESTERKLKELKLREEKRKQKQNAS